MSARIAQLFAHGNVIFYVILCSVRVQNITRITNACFAYFSRVYYAIHRNAHIFNPVQTVKNTKNINAIGGFLDEALHHIIGIIRIAHTVAGPQQHLGH